VERNTVGTSGDTILIFLDGLIWLDYFSRMGRISKVLTLGYPHHITQRGERSLPILLIDELPHVTNKLGDDFVVTATDFPHGDAFRQDKLAQGLVKRGDLSDKLIDKILSANPRRLYSMEE